MHNMGLTPNVPRRYGAGRGAKAVTVRRFAVTLGLAVAAAVAGAAVAFTAPNEKLVLVTVVSDETRALTGLHTVGLHRDGRQGRRPGP